MCKQAEPDEEKPAKKSKRSQPKPKMKSQLGHESIPDESRMRDRIRPKPSDTPIHSICKIMLTKLSEEDFTALHTHMKEIGTLLFASACSGMETPLIALWVLYSILFPGPSPPCSFRALYACEKEKSKTSWENFVHGCCHHNDAEERETLCILKDMSGHHPKLDNDSHCVHMCVSSTGDTIMSHLQIYIVASVNVGITRPRKRQQRRSGPKANRRDTNQRWAAVFLPVMRDHISPALGSLATI